MISTMFFALWSITQSQKLVEYFCQAEKKLHDNSYKITQTANAEADNSKKKT